MQLLTKASYESEPNQRELDNLQVAYEAACESIVLLKNDGALPFSHKKIALYGAGASMTIKGGTGSGEVNERHCVTVLEGLENRGFTVTTKKWIDDFAAYYVQAKADYEVKSANGSIFSSLMTSCRCFLTISACPQALPLQTRM